MKILFICIDVGSSLPLLGQCIRTSVIVVVVVDVLVEEIHRIVLTLRIVIQPHQHRIGTLNCSFLLRTLHKYLIRLQSTISFPCFLSQQITLPHPLCGQHSPPLLKILHLEFLIMSTRPMAEDLESKLNFGLYNSHY